MDATQKIILYVPSPVLWNVCIKFSPGLNSYFRENVVNRTKAVLISGQSYVWDYIVAAMQEPANALFCKIYFMKIIWFILRILKREKLDIAGTCMAATN